MSCSNPVPVRFGNRFINVPCGRCMCCRVSRTSSLQFLLDKELQDYYSRGRGASFVTFTYNDDCIPISSRGYVTLRRRDLQNFIKNVRRQIDYHGDVLAKDFKYVACGENGDKFGRPHYHVVFLGLTDYQVREYSRKCWKYGLVDIRPLRAGAFRYVLKYITKSYNTPQIKALRSRCAVESPFIVHSRYIGKHWIDTHLKDIVQSGFTYKTKGISKLYPKHVRQYVTQHTGVDSAPFVYKFLRKLDKVAVSSGYANISDYMIRNGYLQELSLRSRALSSGNPVDQSIDILQF